MPSYLRAAAIALATTMACSVASAEETTEISVDKLKFSIPKSWKQAEVTNALRLAQFSIPAAAGDPEAAELVISGPFGGTPEANISRWIGQFEANGRTVKMTKGTSPQGEYVFVDLGGTYLKPDGPPILRKTTPVAGYRMHGVMLTLKGGGNYFFKLTGPDKTVAAQGEAFRTSFGGKATDEKEYKLE